MKIHHIQRAIRRSPLSLAESALLSALVDLVDWKSWKCETSLKTLQYETCLSKGAIAKKLKVLEDKGLIKRKRQGDERGHTRSAYTIQIDNLKQFLTPVLPLSPQETTLSPQETTLVASGDYPLSPQETPILPRYSTKNSNLDNQPSNSPKDNARGASIEGVKKEVKRYPKGHFFAGAIIVEEDDWIPEKKNNNPFGGEGWGRKN